ncbi:MAG: hypothetical protein A2315_16525 [Ignavibacteria bacterium RIFOXYB2_FULL_35_12]|nr:MAG: hypothetical protein A2058_09875 [Ignavibacteria bacterium GWA2_36_19]OGU62791.1 MAG: hypothetical protein A2X60_04420 [Ignavibacteria bacterium GWF2_35_20]OGU79254.1 MAG: hypothetical protein A2254_09130 [Ignavibacteria bacterium RIFOXYA2_FULL_35_9]OGU87307.1 MAG: hypothetical protein A3K31_10245 [Ignavibacteria bacterium RIFOXYA12_FULL_35_25]OGU91125.1 MAG: hypothetical protein A2492_02065 [Ignavibacteria bacterium RIFOXYC12_FULL_35_11]OGU97543.1 MAG: hypothetical protein A2347_09540
MNNSKLLQQIARKDSNKEKLAERVIKNSELLQELFAGLQAPEARIKYGSNKVLVIISEKNPAMLYPKLDFFVAQLDSENNFLKWGAIEIIANLCQVDSVHHFENIFSKYFFPIHAHQMITAANTIKAAAKVASFKHNLTEKISEEILKVEAADYETPECNNIVIGQAIKSLDELFPKLKTKEPVFAFVKRQLKNKRPATRKKAENFIRKNQKLLEK